MTTRPADPDALSDAERAEHHAAWSGAANLPRHDYLARLGMKQSVREAVRGAEPRSRRDPSLRSPAAFALVAFGALVLASAIAWPGFSACRTLAQTTGLYAGESMAACTWRGLTRRLVRE